MLAVLRSHKRSIPNHALQNYGFFFRLSTLVNPRPKTTWSVTTKKMCVFLCFVTLLLVRPLRFRRGLTSSRSSAPICSRSWSDRRLLPGRPSPRRTRRGHQGCPVCIHSQEIVTSTSDAIWTLICIQRLQNRVNPHEWVDAQYISRYVSLCSVFDYLVLVCNNMVSVFRKKIHPDLVCRMDWRRMVQRGQLVLIGFLRDDE